MPEDNWWCTVKLVTTDRIFFFPCSIFCLRENRRKKSQGPGLVLLLLFSVTLGTSNLHLEAEIYRNYHKTVMPTCVWDPRVKVLLRWKVLWFLMCFRHMEIGLRSSDNCGRMSGSDTGSDLPSSIEYKQSCRNRHSRQGETFWPCFTFIWSFVAKCVATAFCFRGRDCCKV